MPNLLKSNRVIGEYRVLRAIGKGDGRWLYLANRGATQWLFWLLQSDAPVESLKTHAADEEAFEFEATYFLATPVSGSSLATLASFARTLEWKFMAARWVEITTNLGYLHEKNQVYQSGGALSLDKIVFNGAGEAVPLSYGKTQPAREFSAPAEEQSNLSAASDVYSLGMALAHLISDDQKRTDAPVGLIAVLKQATAADPAKRFTNGTAFANALADFLPRAKTTRAPRSQPNLFPVIAFLTFALLLLIGGAVVYFARAFESPESVAVETTITPLPTPANATRAPGVGDLPAGPLQIEFFKINLSADCGGQVETGLSKGGQPLKGVDVSFDFAANNAPASILQPIRDAGASGQYRGAISLGAGCFDEGIVRMNARTPGAFASKSIYARRPGGAALPNPGGGVGGKLRVGLFQLDTQKNPELTGYFGLTDQTGTAARLQGATDVQVSQDGTSVSDFAMAPVDPNANPLTVALVIDTSGSMSGNPMLQARQAAIDFVNALGPKDAACIFGFSTTVNRVQPCTTDRALAIKGVNALNPTGNTALYDALIAVAADQSKLSGRQAVIVLTDGADTASKSSQADALARLKQTNIPLYTIGLAGKDFNGALLKQIADANGGSYLEAPNAADLHGLYDRIQGQLKAEYRVTFKSLFPDRPTGTVTMRLTQADGQVIEFSRAYVAAK